MNNTAYLVVYIDTKTKPPVVCDAGIYSEPIATHDLSWYPVGILQKTSRHGYGQAKAELLNELAERPDLQWLLGMLKHEF